MTTRIDLGREINTLKPGLIALRRELHQHPELAFEEVRTAATLAGQMRGLGLAVEEGIGGTRVLIPIRKREEWWALAQDERREILELRSRHISTGVKYLPAVARRLIHCRDLGEPFDFLTWFEYAPEDASAFEELVGRLRETEEWSYVEREVDVRVTRGRSTRAPSRA